MSTNGGGKGGGSERTRKRAERRRRAKVRQLEQSKQDSSESPAKETPPMSGGGKPGTRRRNVLKNNEKTKEAARLSPDTATHAHHHEDAVKSDKPKGGERTRKRAERRRRAKLRASQTAESDDVDGVTKAVERLNLSDNGRTEKGNEKKKKDSRRSRKKWADMSPEEKERAKAASREQREKMRERAYAKVDKYFGNMTHLKILQEMCMKLLKMREEDLPQSVRQCQMELADVHVNIFDYVDGILTTRPDLIFDNIDDLIKRCEYLKKGHERASSGHKVGYYPIERAKEEGLRDLLRSLLQGRRRRHRARVNSSSS